MKQKWVIEQALKKTAEHQMQVKDEPEQNKPPGTFGVRHLQIFLIFLGLTITYALRVNLSVAIVAMTDKNSTEFESYEWDEKTRSILLSSFFWGYVLTQVLAGQLAEKYGSKILLFVAIGICSTLTLLTPLCATFGWQYILLLRVLEGLSQGFIFPSTHAFISKWAPVSERAQLGTYCYSGSQFGTVLMLSTSGVLASSSLGWPSIFYLSGAAGVVWSIVWIVFGSNSPATYKHISTKERLYIENSQCSADGEKTIKGPTPWKAIFTSAPFLSLLVAHCAHNWGFWTLLTEMPTYMKSVLHMDIKKNALLSATPYLAMLILSFFFSFLSKTLTKRKCVPLRYSRKLFNSIGLGVPMITLIALGYVTEEQATLAVILLTVGVGLNSATYLGFQCNHIDLAPNHAGTLMGITNMAANIMSLIAPLIVGVVVTNMGDITQWRIVFFGAAAMYLCGNLMFAIFSKTDTQWWNEPKQNQRTIANNNQTSELHI